MKFVYTRQFTYFTILLAAMLLLIFLHVKGFLRPVESALAEIPRPVVYVTKGTFTSAKSFFSFFGSISSLNKTNAQLRQQVQNLQQENIALEQYKLQNDILRKELNYRATANYNFVSANVIGEDPSGLSQIVLIDSGSHDGVQDGDAVLAQGVFIGKIVRTDTFTSQVLLIIDPQSTIDAQIASTGEKGILRGSFSSGVVLDMISQSAQISKDDLVVTAGLTDQVPKNLLIGTIGELQTQKNDLLQTATIIPATDIKNLSFVSVITK